MRDLREAVLHYLPLLEGPESEAAYFGLLDLAARAYPLLMEAFARESRQEARTTLVELVWQSRQPEVLGFLARALRDAQGSVWKEALNGFVALGGPLAYEVLRSARREAAAANPAVPEKLSWIDEALEQIEEAAS